MSERLENLRRACAVAEDIESMLSYNPIESVRIEVWGVQIDEDDPKRMLVILEVFEK